MVPTLWPEWEKMSRVSECAIDQASAVTSEMDRVMFPLPLRLCLEVEKHRLALVTISPTLDSAPADIIKWPQIASRYVLWQKNSTVKRNHLEPTGRVVYPSSQNICGVICSTLPTWFCLNWEMRRWSWWTIKHNHLEPTGRVWNIPLSSRQPNHSWRDMLNPSNVIPFKLSDVTLVLVKRECTLVPEVVNNMKWYGIERRCDLCKAEMTFLRLWSFSPHCGNWRGGALAEKGSFPRQCLRVYKLEIVNGSISWN